jgi:uncharacterized protein YdeI (YjbR/CyaY-like superfamily)
MTTKDTLPIVFFDSQPDWEGWLREHHQESLGVWLKLAKKESGIPSVNYAQALEGALIYGWIDGQKAPLDGQFWLQKFTPRRPKSRWSQVNRAKIEALMEAGRMQPAGLRQVEQAKADGRWEAAYPSQSSMTVPEDLQQALDATPTAQAFFETLDSANRYAVLYRIHMAEGDTARAAMIEKMVKMLAEQKKIHPKAG